MHADEIDIDLATVRCLLHEQFPQWANLPIAPLQSAGTDHWIYRLGDQMVLRLPRLPAVTVQVDKEQCWLPKFVPQLPLAIPEPIAKGQPTEAYPWPWSVYKWLDGENATIEQITDFNQAAVDLAGFVHALQAIDASEGPLPGAHNFYRGVPLADRDRAVRAALSQLQTGVDTHKLTAIWENALQTPVWQEPPLWIHGDLQGGNLLVQKGRLSAVIDFGGLGVGDPACDLMVAWTLFERESRRIFASLLQVDDAIWTRGRAWALSFAVIALPYYRTSNPGLANIARRTIHEVLADCSI